MIDYLDILIARLAIWSLRRGYGAGKCLDIDDSCPACEAQHIVEWLEDHISLIRS